MLKSKKHFKNKNKNHKKIWTLIWPILSRYTLFPLFLVNLFFDSLHLQKNSVLTSQKLNAGKRKQSSVDQDIPYSLENKRYIC